MKVKSEKTYWLQYRNKVNGWSDVLGLPPNYSEADAFLWLKEWQEHSNKPQDIRLVQRIDIVLTSL